MVWRKICLVKIYYALKRKEWIKIGLDLQRIPNQWDEIVQKYIFLHEITQLNRVLKCKKDREPECNKNAR